MKMTHAVDQFGNEFITVIFSDIDLRHVQFNSIETKVVEAANQDLYSDRLIAMAMMAKAIERKEFKKKREQP